MLNVCVNFGNFVSACIIFILQHEDFLLALQMNEEQYQKVV